MLVTFSSRALRLHHNQLISKEKDLFSGVYHQSQTGGNLLHYNFINKHGALNGKSPSELAIPSLQFETPNRWLELINLANKSI